MEEDEDEQAASIKGRLLMLVNKIKGQAHKTEYATKKEQAAPSKYTLKCHQSINKHMLWEDSSSVPLKHKQLFYM